MQKTLKDLMIEVVKSDRAQEGTKERAYLQLLEENVKMRRQLNFWSGVCLVLAGLILLTILFRSL
jgi:hypothetical protein